MKRKRTPFVPAALVSLCLVLSILPGEGLAAGGHPFLDIPTGSAFYQESAEYVYRHGLMEGTGATTFSPDVDLSRGMLVTILGRMDGIDVRDYLSAAPFDDVPLGVWYGPYVAWAAEQGIVTGYDETRFGPYDTVTREQCAAILFRYLTTRGIYLDCPFELDYTDMGQVSDYAWESVAAIDANDLMALPAPDALGPKLTMKRIDVAYAIAQVHKGLEHGFLHTDPAFGSVSGTDSLELAFDRELTPALLSLLP